MGVLLQRAARARPPHHLRRLSGIPQSSVTERVRRGHSSAADARLLQMGLKPRPTAKTKLKPPPRCKTGLKPRPTYRGCWFCELLGSLRFERLEIVDDGGDGAGGRIDELDPGAVRDTFLID